MPAHYQCVRRQYTFRVLPFVVFCVEASRREVNMSRQRMIIWPAVAILCAAGIAYRANVMGKPAPPPPAKVAFVTGGSGPYWKLTVDGAKAAAAKHNVDLRVEMPADDENVEQQMEILGKIDPADVDGIALSPLDAEGQTGFINQLVNRGEKVVTFDSDAPLSARQCHIGTSNFVAGRVCAQLVSAAIPEGGKIAVLLVNLTKENTLDRKGGFQERIAQLADDVPEGSPLKYEVVAYLVDNGNADKCEQNIRHLLAEHSDLAAIVGMNAKHGPILLKVLKEVDMLGKLQLVTFDEAEETLQGVKDGHIYATLAQDPFRFGYEAVAMLSTLCGGDELSVPIVGRGSTYLSTEAIRSDNLDSFRERLKLRQATSGGQVQKAG
jgi:ribose transport system substrate-binding protein